MTDHPRLIEVAFPLKQASIDSVHEKNVRHGHISTLHIWPARRPLAASRAALIATLLPDPGDPDERKAILERLGGRVVTRSKRAKTAGGGYEEQFVEETEGGILHWGRESGPDLVAEVVGFDEQGVLMMPLGGLESVSSSSQVVPTGKTSTVPCGPSVKGRVLDALGRPMDGLGPIDSEEQSP